MSISNPSAEDRVGPFIDAAMAAAALVAAAGGEVGLAERRRVDEVLDNLTSFTTFSPRAAMARFESYADALQRRPEEARTRTLEAVAALADSDEEARAILRIACAVARDDGRYPPRRAARVAEVAEALGRAPPPLLDEDRPAGRQRPRRAFCITVGNQKGGTGKSTTAVHLAVGLLAQGYRVGCIDLDGEQGTFAHYLANRRAFADKSGREVTIPVCRRVEPSEAQDREFAESEDRERLDDALASFADFDYLVIDTPGNQGRLSRLGHINADVLVTPLNDSFLDIDVLAEIDLDERRVLAPSAYAEMVMAQNEERAARGLPPIHWFVMRNRLAHLATHNSRDMTKLLESLAGRMGFRLLPGFSERLVFRELFYKGLTLMDLAEQGEASDLSASRRNARLEIGRLVQAVTACREADRTSDMAAPYDDPDAGEPDFEEAPELNTEDAFQLLQEAMKNPSDGP
ncbi:MAG: division plane positioning ATPase MipZ [Kiloniellales bacterium]|jgi:chromosome partitioning protein|nr:division plane positioning ATPase MipZ [Kiloniellales bacterium]